MLPLYTADFINNAVAIMLYYVFAIVWGFYLYMLSFFLYLC